MVGDPQASGTRSRQARESMIPKHPQTHVEPLARLDGWAMRLSGRNRVITVARHRHAGNDLETGRGPRMGAVSGDGGNRTHVRGRVKGSVYERSRRSRSRPSFAAPAGFRGASPVCVSPPLPGRSRWASPFADAGDPPHGPKAGRQLAS